MTRVLQTTLLLLFLAAPAAKSVRAQAALNYANLMRPEESTYYRTPIGLCEDYPEETTTLEIIRMVFWRSPPKDYYDYEHTPAYQAVDLVRRVTTLLATERLSAVAWYEVKDLALEGGKPRRGGRDRPRRLAQRLPPRRQG